MASLVGKDVEWLSSDGRRKRGYVTGQHAAMYIIDGEDDETHWIDADKCWDIDVVDLLTPEQAAD